MEQYIPKAALVAEIKERIETYNKGYANGDDSRADALEVLLHDIDTLEIKGVDLEKAIDDYIYTHNGRKRLALELDWKCCNLTLKGGDEIIKFAKHFFELGLNASNPLTWEDMLIIHKCIKDAMNYHLYAFQSVEGQQKVYEEVLKRFKAQKGE